MIFKQFFLSTGDIHIGFGSPVTNPRTSILLTCRRIHSEASGILLPSLLPYHFASTVYMIDQLRNMPWSKLTQIRSIRVRGYPFPHDPKLPRDGGHSFAFTLALFPGLQLDRLIIEEAHHEYGCDARWADLLAYADVRDLLKTDGWKEAWFVTPTTSFLTSTQYERIPGIVQPQAWDKRIKERDGEDSGAECTMYIAKEAGKTGAAENSATREEWQFELPNSVDSMGRSTWTGRDKVDEREVLVVVKRGGDAQYVNDGSGLHPLIKIWFEEIGWEELKALLTTWPEDDTSAHR